MSCLVTVHTPETSVVQLWRTTMRLNQKCCYSGLRRCELQRGIASLADNFVFLNRSIEGGSEVRSQGGQTHLEIPGRQLHASLVLGTVLHLVSLLWINGVLQRM